VIRQLLAIAWAITLLASLVLASLPRLRNEALASQSLRRRAGWLTTAFGVGGLPFAIWAIMSLPIGGPPNRWGMIGFLILAAIVAAGCFAVPGAWGLARRTQLAELREAGQHPSQLLADAPEPPAPHIGLSGQESAPTRW
jgi:hypothetical protein